MKETIYILYFERGYTMRPNSEKLIKHLLESQPKTSNQLAERYKFLYVQSRIMPKK